MLNKKKTHTQSINTYFCTTMLGAMKSDINTVLSLRSSQCSKRDEDKKKKDSN